MGGSDRARDPGDVAVSLQELLLGAEGTESFLAEVSRAAVAAIPAALACGVSVAATEWARIMGATSDDVAGQMDAVQYEVGDGPCLTALRDGVTVAVDDIAADGRWPEFSRRGRQQRVGCSLSVPMLVRGRPVGALNLYAREANALSDDDRTRGRGFAEQAAGAVALGLRLAEREERNRHLETALRSRSTIDQAIGIVMARARIDASAAFGVLQTRSQHTNVKLRDVALGVIAEVTQPPPG